jgi:hypothetical protein
MKTFIRFSFLISLIIIVSCRGEQGPPGQDGLDGLDGESFLGSVFEIQGDFLPENEFRLSFDFPNTIEVFESDIVLVYILWEQAEVNGGADLIDVWRLLPQTVFIEDKILQYNFDYTFSDVQIFLDGTIDFNNLLPGEALDQVFRIVVFPADFAKNNRLDISDYNLMMKSLKILPEAVIIIDINE